MITLLKIIGYISVAILIITFIYRRGVVPFFRPVHCKSWHRWFTWRSFELRGPISEVGELHLVRFLGFGLWRTRFYRYDSNTIDRCFVPRCKCKPVVAKDGEALLNPVRRSLILTFKPWQIHERHPNFEIVSMR